VLKTCPLVPHRKRRASGSAGRSQLEINSLVDQPAFGKACQKLGQARCGCRIWTLELNKGKLATGPQTQKCPAASSLSSGLLEWAARALAPEAAKAAELRPFGFPAASLRLPIGVIPALGPPRPLGAE